MTASVINFVEELIGVKNKAIYDGSWSEFVKFILFLYFHVGISSSLSNGIKKYYFSIKNK